MKILQVKLSTMPIPPNGWGAVEKIIWAYTQELIKLGHECEFAFINEVNLDDYDIIHCHAYNHAKELAERGYKVFYSHHDHHSFVFGKEYKELFHWATGGLYSESFRQAAAGDLLCLVGLYAFHAALQTQLEQFIRDVFSVVSMLYYHLLLLFDVDAVGVFFLQNKNKSMRYLN